MYIKSKTFLNDPDYKKHKRQENANAHLKSLRKLKRVERDYTGIKPQMDLSTTSNVADESVVEETISNQESAPSNIPANMISSYQQGLKDFFARPIILDQFSISDSFSTSPFYELSSLFHENSMWKSKVQGFYGVRGTFVIKAQFNAQPFQQGVYMLQYLPMYKEQKYANGKSSTWFRESYIMTRTQLPRAEIDVSEQTEVTLKIPHRSLSSHYNLLTKLGTWGVVFLSTYIQLDNPPVSTIRDVNVTLWASVEDIEFAEATAPIDDLTPQMDISLEENKPGPVEKIAEKVESVSMLASAIPVLAPVASPLAWASNIAKRVASIFGWSKPVNSEKITRVYQTSNMYQQNCDGVDNAFNLGLMAENKVCVMPSLSGNNMDEMSISFIKSKFSCFEQLTWRANSSRDSLLFKTPVCPAQFTNTVSIPKLILMTPIAGLAHCFMFWRGSLKFRFKIAKTKFHSGRLIVSFVPGYMRNSFPLASNSFKTSLANTQFLHRTILDIRESSDFEFVVPYINMFPYCKTNQGIGTLQLHVLNPLVSPDIVSSFVRINVEVAGGTDLEFAGPKAPNYFPAQGSFDGLIPSIAPVYDKTVIEQIAHFREFGRFTVGTISEINAANFLMYGTSTFSDDRARIGLPRDVFDQDDNRIFLDINERNKFFRYRIVSQSQANELIDNYSFIMFKQYVADEDFYIIASVRAEDTTDYYLSIMKIDNDIVAQMDLGALKDQNVMLTDDAQQCIGEQILSVKQLAMRSIPFGSPATRTFVNSGTRFPSRPHLVYSNKQTEDQLYFHDYYSYFGSCYAYSRGGSIIRSYKIDSHDSSNSLLFSLGFDTSNHVMTPVGQDFTFKSNVFERIDTPTILSAYVPMYNETFGRLNARVVNDDIGVAHPFGQSVYVTTSDMSLRENDTFLSRCAADDTQFSFFLGFPPMEER